MTIQYNKSAILFLILLAFCFHSIAQKSIFPKGAYLSLEELRKKSPSLPYIFTINKRTIKAIKTWGGNDYEPTTTASAFAKGRIKDEIFAISNGDTLFINGTLIKRESWYVNISEEGKRLLVFKAAVTYGGNALDAGLAYGASGAIVEGFEGNRKTANMRFWNILDLETGKVQVLNKKYVSEIIATYPELKDKFVAEQNNGSTEILLKYIQLINSSPEEIISCKHNKTRRVTSIIRRNHNLEDALKLRHRAKTKLNASGIKED